LALGRTIRETSSPREFGNRALPLSPGDFGKLMQDEIDKFTKVIKFAGQEGMTTRRARRIHRYC
jgi:hypothetical protein